MRKISISKVFPGMITARTVYSSSGHVLLSKGMSLNPMFIRRLKELGIPAIYIQEGYLGDRTEVEDVVSEKTRVETQQTVRRIFTEINRNKRVDIGAAKAAVNNIVDELLRNRRVVLNLTDIRSYDDYIFGHCVNVCILSVMTAITLEYNELQLRDLGVGAILHDIGKLLVSKDILNKPGKLAPAEMDKVKEHSKNGFDILREQQELSLLAAHIAFQHHEKVDGTGYPRGLKGGEIHEFSRLAAVADVYDALTADRVYRKAFMPHEALKIISEGSGTHFDSEVVRAFMEKVAPFPIGTIVALNTGEVGVVVDNHRKKPARPVIRLVLGAGNQNVDVLAEVDLLKNTEVEITRVLNEDDPLIPAINEMSMRLQDMGKSIV
ncbi:MAG: HD-GYP domain-containing protein [Bacillota bacterium]